MTVVVAGAGLAGLRVCESLRGHSHRERILLVGAEAHLPYDRPPLSKQLLTGKVDADRLTLRSAAELDELGIELRRGDPAVALDVTARTVTLAGGDVVRYTALVVATGATPIPLPGAAARGVLLLRTLDDALALRSALAEEPRVLVVGAGFIGLEVAASARSRGCAVTVVDLLPHPLARVLPEPLGRAVQRLHADRGVQFRFGVGVREVVGDPVRGVVLDDGGRLDADLVVVGIGVRPATGWLEGSGLSVADGVLTDATLQAAPSVWAVGDVARWPLPGGETARVEHWTNAAEQAQAVAAAIATGHREAFTPVPYFWSDHYTAKLQSLGFPSAADEVHLLHGSLGEDKWVTLLHRGDRVAGVVGLRSAARVMRARAVLASGAGFAEARVELEGA